MAVSEKNKWVVGNIKQKRIIAINITITSNITVSAILVTVFSGVS
jgi:hypothetical protein